MWFSILWFLITFKVLYFLKVLINVPCVREFDTEFIVVLFFLKVIIKLNRKRVGHETRSIHLTYLIIQTTMQLVITMKAVHNAIANPLFRDFLAIGAVEKAIF